MSRTLPCDFSSQGVRAVLAERGVEAVDWSGWRAIDAAERKSGSDASRPRVKFVAIDEMVAAARA